MTEVPQSHRIDVNEYGPDVKSLGFRTPEGNDATVGVINPGKPQTFPTDRKEMFTVISGKLQVGIKGIPGTVILETGQTFMFPPNSSITLIALDEQQVAYRCVYIPHEERPATGETETAVDTSTTADALKIAAGGGSESPFSGSVG